MNFEWKICNIRTFSKEEAEKALALMSQKRRDKLCSRRMTDDRLRTLAAESTARSLVRKITGLGDERIIILEGENGKPFLKEIDLHISLSHTADFAAAAVCREKIGIDAEQIRNIDMKIAERICSDGEKKYIFGDAVLGADISKECETDILKRFFRIWTLKEAAVKCTGEGIKDISKTDVMPIIDLPYAEEEGIIISAVTESDIKRAMK